MAKGLRKRLTSYGDEGFALFLRKAFIKAMGYSDDALDRPIVGITNTYSDYNPCHGNVPALVEAVKRGVMLAGAMPMVFPTISIHESFAHPTSMFLRNLMAMDTEEMIRAQPMDAVVIIGGCDKTLPAQIMAAASVDLPAIVVPVGPMVVGHHHGRGARRLHRLPPAVERASRRRDRRGRDRGGERPAGAFGRHLHGDGHGLDHGLHHRSAGPVAADERHHSGAACRTHSAGRGERTHRRAHGRRGRAAAERLADAGRVPQRHGGDAGDRRLDQRRHPSHRHRQSHAASASSLDTLDEIGREVPVLVDLKPSGAHYMEHFHHAGGVPRLLAQLGDLIDLDAATVAGGTLRDVVANAEDVPGQEVIRPRSDPIKPEGSMVVLYGNLAPGGAILKQAAATPRLLQHTGRAVVFEACSDMAARDR